MAHTKMEHQVALPAKLKKKPYIAIGQYAVYTESLTQALEVVSYALRTDSWHGVYKKVWFGRIAQAEALNNE